MTDEERQRQMDFIVSQQAEFSVNMDKLAQSQRRSDEKWARTEEGIRSLLAIAEIHEREISDLKESIRETSVIARAASESARAASEAGRAASEAALAASEAGRTTDERLNALIIMVEKYLSERRNGKDRGSQ
jgi:hypothetical protein